MLCKKIVNFFSLLSHTQESGVRRLGMTQELLSLVTGLAHYLKILIRIALTCALKLVRLLFDHICVSHRSERFEAKITSTKKKVPNPFPSYDMYLQFFVIFYRSDNTTRPL
jgi:hypothetical protein